MERLGPDDGEVAFQGTFSGANAEARVRAFDNLRLSGEIVWLNWESFRRRVVVKSFVADYHSPWWIPYKVSCVVVHQTGVAAASQISTLSAMVSADLGSALSAVAGSSDLTHVIADRLSGTNALTRGTSDQVAGGRRDRGHARRHQQPDHPTIRTACRTGGSKRGSWRFRSDARRYSEQCGIVGGGGQCWILRRADRNEFKWLRELTCRPSPRSAANLFEIAATQLGSALQWINIARANKFDRPDALWSK